ncbi:transcriptional regulator [Treponema medium]|uniref:Transcriptional regulator n=1 Tax=Treponema medium TaxID=58231 RepID=A0ABX7LXZ7_TREMD|nr:transcriptional regulator [Treponema medium]QSH97847.1 transcriptional regulator [Treponema medium]
MDTCYSCGGFNTPTLCVVTKGIKADCNHLMRTTYPDICVGVC